MYACERQKEINPTPKFIFYTISYEFYKAPWHEQKIEVR